MASTKKPGATRRGPAAPTGRPARGGGHGPARALSGPRGRGPSGGARRPAEAAGTAADVDGAFQLVKGLLERYVHSLQVLFNTPENYTLVSRRHDAKGMQPEFGVVLKLKGHVVLRLPPLAQFRELATELPPPLQSRMQGKSSFSFVRPEPEVVAPLDALLRATLLRFRQAGMA